MRSVLLGLMWLSMAANAGEISAWERADFSGERLAGNDGWENGYAEEPWGTWEGYAFPYTDDRNDESTPYGIGSSLDNWLIRGDLVNDGATSFRLYNDDDDTVGIVFKHSTAKQFYMLVHHEDDAPYPLQNVSEATWSVVRVSLGQGSVLTQASGRKFRFGDGWDFVDVRVEYNDGDIRALVNGEEIFDVTDPEPLPAGRSGFYAYNNGYDDSSGETVVYESIEVTFWDEDDDGVKDDTDNCEYDGNPDQADADDDGIGDVCDESPGNNGGNDDAPNDDDSGQTGDDGGVDPGDGITGVRACGCSAGASSFGFWWALLPGAFLWMRSRRG